MIVDAAEIVCPVGMNAAAACAARRAGISAFTELPYHDLSGQPIIGAFVPGLTAWFGTTDRLVELATRVLAGLFRATPSTAQPIPLLLALAEPDRPGGLPDSPELILARLVDAFLSRFHKQSSRVVATGHAGGLQALRTARELLSSGAADACVVCGVDSLINSKTLTGLEESFRLKTPANRDGVIPGEAAAAVVVRLNATSPAGARIAGLGFGEEEATVASNKPLRGLGLAAAARTALAEAGLGLHEIDCRLSDVAGELYGFKELPLVEGRLMRVVRKKEQPLWHWAECIGDGGAAAGIAQLVAAHDAYRKNYAPGERMICLTSSAGGHRAAAVLRRAVRASTESELAIRRS